MPSPHRRQSSYDQIVSRPGSTKSSRRSETTFARELYSRLIETCPRKLETWCKELSRISCGRQASAHRRG